MGVGQSVETWLPKRSKTQEAQFIMGALSILVLLVWMFIFYINDLLVMRSATPRSNGVHTNMLQL